MLRFQRRGLVHSRGTYGSPYSGPTGHGCPPTGTWTPSLRLRHLPLYDKFIGYSEAAPKNLIKTPSPKVIKGIYWVGRAKRPIIIPL